MNADWQAPHALACERGEELYQDPQSGFWVFTRVGLLRRGACCSSGCRHCPYGSGDGEIPRPHWVGRRPRRRERPASIVFWSGGKDSFLALKRLMGEGVGPVVLLTTYHQETRRIANQEIPFASVEEQAAQLGLPLIGVPLNPSVAYEDAVMLAMDMVSATLGVSRLVFGDLHLDGIREWREQTFKGWMTQNEAESYYPLWGEPYEQLIQELEASGITITVSSSYAGIGGVGEAFDADFRSRLPAHVDAMGENGEFHTVVSGLSLV